MGFQSRTGRISAGVNDQINTHFFQNFVLTDFPLESEHFWCGKHLNLLTAAADGGPTSALKNPNGVHVLTCEAACVLLSVAVHLALMAGQNLLHKVQHSKVLHHIVEQNCI